MSRAVAFLIDHARAGLGLHLAPKYLRILADDWPLPASSVRG